jgi:PTS system nitrogen regulatory IIA component
MLNIKFDNSHISINDNSKSKKSVLEKLSLLLSGTTGIGADIIFNKLYEREKLGSTSVGNGVALPHARLEGISVPFISVVVLEEAIDFDNIDDFDVDIIVCLIVPYDQTENHLTLLSSLSQILDNISNRKRMRDSRNSEQIIASLKSENLNYI